MAVQFIKDQVWTWFANEAVPWFVAALKGVLNALVRWLGPVAVVILKVTTVVMVICEISVAAISQLAYSFHEMLQMELFKPDGALLTYGVFINRFVPLTETFAMAIVIANIYVLMIVFRWLKSLIPTMAN